MNNRQSGVELLKIIGMFSIILYHLLFTTTLSGDYDALISSHSFYLPLQYGVSTLQEFLLLFIRLFCGSFGNWIFIISSAYFLATSEKTYYLKACHIWIETWIISIIFLVLGISFRCNISEGIVLRSCFPIFLGSNWYICFYILLLFLLPLLQKIIKLLTPPNKK